MSLQQNSEKCNIFDNNLLGGTLVGSADGSMIKEGATVDWEENSSRFAEEVSSGRGLDVESSSELNEDEGAEDEKEDPVCPVCGGTPCEWLDFGAEVVQELENMFEHREDGVVIDPMTGDTAPSSTLRFLCYSAFTRAKFGSSLGKFN